MTPIWASLGPIDRDIQWFLREITDCIMFTQFLHNSTLKPLFDKFNSDDIHWPLTQDWLHFNPTDDICSSHKSIYDAFKIKSLNHILHVVMSFSNTIRTYIPRQEFPAWSALTRMILILIWVFAMIFTLSLITL